MTPPPHGTACKDKKSVCKSEGILHNFRCHPSCASFSYLLLRNIDMELFAPFDGEEKVAFICHIVHEGTKKGRESSELQAEMPR